MKTTSELYKRLLQDTSHIKEIMLDIAGTEYTQTNIISANIRGALFSTPGIGNCVSRQGEFEIFPQGEIPKQAKIKPYVRLVLGEEKSEWIQKGEFYISKRQKDKITGKLKISAYDGMLKLEDIWLDSTHATVSFPMSQADAVADIAGKAGIEVDERTWGKLSSLFPVELPIGEEGEYTMREVMGYIAVSNAGNWIITDEGKLLLIAYGGIPEETFYLVTDSGEAILWGDVRIVVE